MAKKLTMENTNLPVRWEMKTIGEVCDVRDGTHDSPKYQDEGYPLITSKNLKNGKIVYNKVKYISENDFKHINKRSKVDIGDILFAMIGTIGNPVVVVNKPNYAIKNVALFKVGELLDSNYLKYYLSSQFVIDKMQREAKGTTQKFVGLGYLRKFSIPLPPLTQQKQILAILDKAFAAIDTAKANAEQNLQNAKELFESYLQNVFENKGEDWEEKKLDEVCEITSKLIDPKESEYQNLIHIGAGNIVSEKGTLIKLKTAKEEKLISGKFLFDESMVLYSKIRPYLMKIVKCEFKGLCSADIYPLVPFKNKITQSFLYHLLSSNHFTEYAIKGSQRAGMPKVNRKHLFDFSFYCPSIEEQKQIIRKLDSLSAETKKLESIYTQKIADLEEMKKSVLQKAFSGQLSEL